MAQALTEAKKTEALNLLRSGKTIADTARVMRVSATTIKKIKKEGGSEPPAPTEGTTPKPGRIPAETRAKVLEALEGGMSTAEAGRMFGVNPGTVNYWKQRALGNAEAPSTRSAPGKSLKVENENLKRENGKLREILIELMLRSSVKDLLSMMAD